MTEEDLQPTDSQQISEGQIVEWNQDHWWQEGKTRIQKDKKFYQTKKGVVALMAIIILLVVVLLLISGMDGAPQVHDEDTTQEEVEQEWSQTTLQEQIKRLRSLLNKADPAIRETPLPQVEMSIQIEMD